MSHPNCQPRSGLLPLAKLLESNKPVAIAYLGGSITQAGDGYRHKTTCWFMRRHPDAKITEISAAIGGTASDLGAYRLEQDVLRHKPDLLFVEFAVNDNTMDNESILASMEGITRHALGSDKPPLVCFIYTISKAQLDDYRNGGRPRTVEMHETIAAHYNLPTVNMGASVAAKVMDGTLQWDDFAPDGAHPLPAGHELYAQTLTEAMEKLLSIPARGGALPAPLTAKPREAGCLVHLTPMSATEGWTYRPMKNNGGWECFDGVLESATPGAEVSFNFNGSTLGFFYHLGPESGNAEVSFDGGPFEHVELVDPYAKHFWRPSYRLIKTDLAPGPHCITLRVSERQPVESKGNSVRLASLLVEDSPRRGGV